MKNWLIAALFLWCALLQYELHSLRQQQEHFDEIQTGFDQQVTASFLGVKQ